MQQTTLEQRRQFQQHALNTAAPERFIAAGWLAIFSQAVAVLLVIGSIAIYLSVQPMNIIVPIGGMMTALILACLANIIHLLRASERNQRISHELQIRLLERAES